MDYEEDEWSPLRTATAALHEMFVTLMDSGFEEHQALQLVSTLMTNGIFEADSDD